MVTQFTLNGLYVQADDWKEMVLRLHCGESRMPSIARTQVFLITDENKTQNPLRFEWVSQECLGEDSNLHAHRAQALNLLRMPFRHRGIVE